MTELDLGPNGALCYAMEYIEARNLEADSFIYIYI